MQFHPEKFVELLSYMATGMLGIFLVMAAIIVITVLLNQFTKK